MKKTILFKAMAVIVAMTASVSLVSCGDDDDDDNDPVDPTAIKAVSVQYSVDASDDLCDFYDIAVTHGIDGTQSAPETLDIPGWSFTATYGNGSTVLPKSVSCRIVATPKAQTPDIDTDAVYSFKADYSMMVNGVRNDNQKTVLSYRSGTHPSISIKGDKVRQYLDRGEIVIVDYNYEIKD